MKPLLIALGALLAAAPASGPTTAARLIGNAAFVGDSGSPWMGWVNTRQVQLDTHAMQAFRSGDRALVTLERRLEGTSARSALTVVAAVEFKIPKGHELSEQGLCEWDGRATPLVFAVVATAKPGAEYHPRVRAAWLLDLARDRIEPLPAAAVRCGNAAYGP
ncbi:MAG TPA: hypothetical protein VLT47_00950 [Anaeromyxobacteraceae bacterium]|nr:hypothetical protein [Anaeromyxobacteraceae bacterium]